MGCTWVVQPDGSVGNLGDNPLYAEGGKLTIGTTQWAPQQPTAVFDRKHSELVLSSSAMNGLNISRRVAVNAPGGWCRWVESFENAGAATVKVHVRLGFSLSDQVQVTQPLAEDPKDHKPTAIATFDGAHALAMIGAGRGTRLMPRFVAQAGNNETSLEYDLEVPKGQTRSIVHIQLHRQKIAELSAAIKSIKEAEFLAGLPPAVVKQLANFSVSSKLIGGAEVLRGGLLDVIETRNKDLYQGTLKEPTFRLNTFFGPLELPAERVVSMTTVGTYRPSQFFVTGDGEVIGGQLQSDAVRFQLSSGQVTSVPLQTITRLGYRIGAGEVDDWKFDKPMVFLRDGQRIAIEAPAETIPVSTIYGPIQLKPASLSALVFEGQEQSVHQVRLADGSRFAALVAKDVFDLKLRSVAGAKVVPFPAASIARLQIAPDPADPDEQTPVLTLTNGDVLVGTVAGAIQLETGFDTIQISGAEVGGLEHVPAPADGAPASPAEVQVRLWDQATVSGRLKGDAVECQLKSGALVKVPVALIARFQNPEPTPGQQVIDRIKAKVAELNDTDWKRRDRAADTLTQLGPGVAALLQQLRPGQTPEGQQRIDDILHRLAEAKREPAVGELGPGMGANPPGVPQIIDDVAPNGPGE